jgi:4-carboxymuconolactone decarboxylase
MPDFSSPPRIAPLARNEWTDAAREVFGFWEGPEGRANGSRSATMMTLANHPKLAMRVLKLGKYILIDSSLSLRQKELIVLRVSWRYRCDYEWAHHVHSARKLGMTDLEFDDETWSTLAAKFDRHQLMDFLFTVGFIKLNAGALVSMGVQLEPEFESFSTPVNEMKHIQQD